MSSIVVFIFCYLQTGTRKKTRHLSDVDSRVMISFKLLVNSVQVDNVSRSDIAFI